MITHHLVNQLIMAAQILLMGALTAVFFTLFVCGIIVVVTLMVRWFKN